MEFHINPENVTMSESEKREMNTKLKQCPNNSARLLRKIKSDMK